jgi:hypothetical protein
MQDRERSLAAARAWQTFVCIAMLAAIGLSTLVVDAAVHSEAFGIWLDRQRFDANVTAPAYERQFLDTEDRLALKEIPNLDPRSGGVYFFGASTMKWAMRAPDLPPEQRKLVHNFGAGEGSPYLQRQFSQYLIRDKNILSAGPGKTLIVFGTTFLNARSFGDISKQVFTNMWRRYGLYRYDYLQGIEPVTRWPGWDAYALERARWTSFVQASLIRVTIQAVPAGLKLRRNEKDPAVIANNYKRQLGPDWEERIRQHRRELQDWFDELLRQGVEFRIVLLPRASWTRPLPYPPKYQAMIEEFCAANRVPLTDYSNLLTDDEFVDHSHVNVNGLPKIDSKLMEIARDFLQAKGVWPATPPVPKP